MMETGSRGKRRRLEIRTDDHADAAYISLSKSEVHLTKEVGEFIVDYSRTGRVLGIEILGLRDYLARNGEVIRIPPEFLPSPKSA